MTMTYAIIKLGGKQYRVQEGEKLLVDRLKTDEGATFTPDLLFVPGGDGAGVTVTARVVGHVKGDKLRIGKYRKRTGYKRHNGFRASLTQIEIESIGGGKGRAAATKQAAAAAAAPVVTEPKAAENLAALPDGYAELKVAEVTAQAKTWARPLLEAALAYEQGHAARKGALAAVESALAKLDEEEAEDGA
jgi:large subunit ribosomal protein L21